MKRFIKIKWLLLVCFSLLMRQNVVAERTKELGFVSYTQYDYTANYDYTAKAYLTQDIRMLFNKANNLLAAEEVSVDIFLAGHEKERDSYKRLFIPWVASCFFAEMYDGMRAYVENGGLLITNSSLVLIDSNESYKVDDGAKRIAEPGLDFIGIYGHAEVSVSKIKVESACPLTEGLPGNKWLDLNKKPMGRVVTKASAEVAMTGTRCLDPANTGWKPSEGDQPFLTFKHFGKGACIYVMPILSSEAMKNEYIGTIFKNTLSQKTLKWLTSE